MRISKLVGTFSLKFPRLRFYHFYFPKFHFGEELLEEFRKFGQNYLICGKIFTPANAQKYYLNYMIKRSMYLRNLNIFGYPQFLHSFLILFTTLYMDGGRECAGQGCFPPIALDQIFPPQIFNRILY